MITAKYMSAKQAKKISEVMKDRSLINRKTDFNVIDSFIEYLEYELMETALNGSNHCEVTLSEDATKLNNIISFLENEGYDVRYEEFDDFKSDPPYAVGKLKISW